jgi:hypothetical protein
MMGTSRTVAAVACPGPSLEMMPGADHFAFTIGVNRVPCSRVCDYAAFMDEKTWEEIKRSGGYLGQPKVITSRWMPALLYPELEGMQVLTLLDAARAVGLPRRSYTVNNAVQAAVALGAEEVRLYGVDWSGTLDWDGAKVCGDRSEDRWAAEKRVFERVCQDLKQTHGTIVRRMVL